MGRENGSARRGSSGGSLGRGSAHGPGIGLVELLMTTCVDAICSMPGRFAPHPLPPTGLRPYGRPDPSGLVGPVGTVDARHCAVRISHDIMRVCSVRLT